MREAAGLSAVFVVAAVALGAARAEASPPPAAPEEPGAAKIAFCAPPPEPRPPEYYAFPLVVTSRVPGTARAGGRGEVVFPSTSPYGVAVSEDGSYRYRLHVSTEGLPEPRAGEYVVWVTTPSVDRIRRLGSLPDGGEIRGEVRWNKFLVVVTLEPESEPARTGDGGSDSGSAGRDDGASAPGEAWKGPIVLRGMSRSGMMHTMAGHGPFEQENCATYGYD